MEATGFQSAVSCRRKKKKKKKKAKQAKSHEKRAK